AQVLIASTYPIEAVVADRWTRANSTLTGNALATELEKQTWDPSVRSLVSFPTVLSTMADKLDWTLDLGNALLGQQKVVLETVQKLRGKAALAGNLESGKEQTTTRESQDGKDVILIRSTDPEIRYVPTYDPNLIYGPSMSLLPAPLGATRAA